MVGKLLNNEDPLKTCNEFLPFANIQLINSDPSVTSEAFVTICKEEDGADENKVLELESSGLKSITSDHFTLKNSDN